jgi:pyridoxine kinase
MHNNAQGGKHQGLAPAAVIGHSGALANPDPKMARVLALSSHVAYGTVGLAVTVPALQALGHETIVLPTIVLSNHPGYARFSGEQVPPATLAQIIDSLAANGWLAGVDAILTGYLPSEAHVDLAGKLVARVRAANPSAYFVCDPIFGDEPDGLYLDAPAAAIREHLLPQCNLATPNRFELSWLVDAPVASVAEAVTAARALAVPAVLATSVPAGAGDLASLLVWGEAASACQVPRRGHAPHGTGDLLAALLLGHLLNRRDPTSALGCAVAAVAGSIEASGEQDELSLAGAGSAWAHAEPLPTAAI